MIRNYILSAIRNLYRNRIYTLINVFGLSIGMVVSLMIFLWVIDKLSFDRFHKDIDRLYRVVQTDHLPGGEVDHYTITPTPLASVLRETIPEIEDVSRVMYAGWNLSVADEKEVMDTKYVEKLGVYADPGFFRMFSYNFGAGDPSVALNEINSIIISRELSIMLFGDENALGKKIQIENWFDLTVTGIIYDKPDNSHLRFDFVVPFELLRKKDYNFEGWANNHFTYVRLLEQSDFSDVEQKISGIIKDNIPDSPAVLSLQPVKNISLKAHGGGGMIVYVYIFSLIASFILIIACVNYINLTTAQYTKRIHEVSMRKIVGASRIQLIIQYLGESILMTLIAANFALIIVHLFLPEFNSFFSSNVTLNYNFSQVFLIISFVVVTGLFSGIYPAFTLSRSKGGYFSAKDKVFRSGISIKKMLVIFQFIIAIFLISGTIAVLKQYNFLVKRNPGFNSDRVICIQLKDRSVSKYEIFRERLLQDNNIDHVTISNTTLDFWEAAAGADNIAWEGMREEDYLTTLAVMSVDSDFIDTYKMDMIEGRNFSRDLSSDVKESFILNETAVRQMGLENPVGKKIKVFEFSGIIIGVVSDFNYSHAGREIKPMALSMIPDWHDVVSIRITPDDVRNTISSIERSFSDIYEGTPFQYDFASERFNNLYTMEKKLTSVIRYAAVFAILISALGLFGLSLFSVEQRTKEIAIRKVSGATALDILWLLYKTYTKWILLALIVGLFLSFYVLRNWLSGYAVHTTLSWWIFAITSGIVTFIAWITISYQSLRISNLNPVKSLRYE